MPAVPSRPPLKISVQRSVLIPSSGAVEHPKSVNWLRAQPAPRLPPMKNPVQLYGGGGGGSTGAGAFLGRSAAEATLAARPMVAVVASRVKVSRRITVSYYFAGTALPLARPLHLSLMSGATKSHCLCTK